jgi:hypothetical protein
VISEPRPPTGLACLTWGPTRTPWTALMAIGVSLLLPLQAVASTPSASATDPEAPSAPAPPAELSPRAKHAVALGLEAGWNSLTGVGPVMTFYPHRLVGIDAGAGLSAMGGKLGLRLRATFIDGPATPFIGAGITWASGTSQDIQTVDQGNTVSIRLKASSFAQITGGVDLMSESQWTFIGAVGYAILLGGENVTVTSGVPDPVQQKAFDLLYKSGIVVSISVGRSF